MCQNAAKNATVWLNKAYCFLLHSRCRHRRGSLLRSRFWCSHATLRGGALRDDTKSGCVGDYRRGCCLGVPYRSPPGKSQCMAIKKFLNISGLGQHSSLPL